MVCTIKIPANLGIKGGKTKDIISVISQFNRGENSVCIDASGLEFISPTGICLIRSIISDCETRGVTIDWVKPIDSSIQTFLEAMRLHKPNENTLDRKSHAPLTKITQENIEQTNFLSSVSEFVSSQGLSNQQLVRILDYSLPEIVQNIFHHSGVCYGYVSMMYYKAINTLEVAIIDNGIGIHESLSKNVRFPSKLIDDKQAISLAIQPKISGTSDKNLAGFSNGGEGLYWVSEAVKKNAGQLYIHSGDGCLLVNASKLLYNETAHWRGTLVSMNINLNHLFDLKEIFKDKDYTVDDDLFDIKND